MTFNDVDIAYMRRALDLARGQLGQVWPNPSVGCVLVRDGQVIAEGVTGVGGRPHGEQVALGLAGSAARDTTAYINLEPCAHVGETPSCARLLVDAGVARVVYATFDPDQRVSGRGAEMLREAGVEVESGLLQMDAEDLNEGFFRRVRQFRPMVTMKLATSRDGKIARGEGDDPWITGPDARMKGHELRANHDAILVGVGTVIADDPSLTCRLPGQEGRSPVRVILDNNLRTPLDSQLVRTAEKTPTWIVVGIEDETVLELGARPFLAEGVKIINMKAYGNLDLALRLLGDQGITRLLVEGGAEIYKSFLEGGFVDHMAWFQAPIDIGARGLDVSAILAADSQGTPQGFKRISSSKIGEDMLVNFTRTR